MTLPAGWRSAHISEVADLKLGKMLDKIKNKGELRPYLRNINVRWRHFELSDLAQMRVTSEEAEQLSVCDGDLFICEGGEPGRAAVWRGGTSDLVFQKALHRVRPHVLIDPEFIAAYLDFSARQGLFADFLTGTTIKHLPQDALSRISLPLAPANEQRRIVTKLDTLAANVARARTELSRVAIFQARLRSTTLRQAVTGTLTQRWREQITEFEAVSKLLEHTPMPIQGRGGREATDKVIPGRGGLSVNDPGSALPLGWQWVSLLRVAKQETGHTPSRLQPSYWDGGVPWVGIRDAGAHHGRWIDKTAQTISDEGLANSSARLLPAGTVCLSRTASVGYVTILGRAMATSQDFATWTCSSALLPEYLMLALLAEGDDIRKFGMGSTHTTIYFPEIRALHIALPPLEEQREIVARTEAAFARAIRLEAEAARATALLDRLEVSILAKAFRGELVLQDPADEPASALLDRIRAERAAAQKPRRGRGAAGRSEAG